MENSEDLKEVKEFLIKTLFTSKAIQCNVHWPSVYRQGKGF